MKVTKRLRLYGKVQGVYFRGSMYHQARTLGATGWVRNRRDGTLEAVVQGSQEAVETLIRWARRGPELAVVENMEISDAEGDYERFSQLDTC
ncbi:MAG: acylphosphatase [Burkholderiales bacterium]